MIEFSIHYPIVHRVDEPSHDTVRIELVFPKRPFLFWCDSKVGESPNLPKGFGVAWFDYVCNRFLFAPLPFNVIVSLVIWLWLGAKYRIAYKLASSGKNLMKRQRM